MRVALGLINACPMIVTLACPSGQTHPIDQNGCTMPQCVPACAPVTTMCPVGSVHEIDPSGCVVDKCVAQSPGNVNCPDFAFETCPSGYTHAINTDGCVMPQCIPHPDHPSFSMGPWMTAAIVVILILAVHR